MQGMFHNQGRMCSTFSIRRRCCRVAKHVWALLPAVVLYVAASYGASSARTAEALQNDADVLQYISATWKSLTRSMTDCSSLVDPKVSKPPVLYLPADFNEPPSVKALTSTCKVDVEHLPAVIHHLGDLDTTRLPPGLLYLPMPYVVPGGMFNEMYGWDSYFIIRGLLEDGDLGMARNMVENFRFEIENYGSILNSNRTSHLTRSQPPFFTAMVRAVYEAELARGQKDLAWLERAYPDAVRVYELWLSAAHLAGSTGLSRYFGFGEGPVPELGADGGSYYRGVMAYLLLHADQDSENLVVTNAPAGLAIGPRFFMALCNAGPGAPADRPVLSEACDTANELSLSRDFYTGDRSMRESGYDVSFRFGPYGANTQHYAPVDLNSLLYKTETDLAWMNRELGHPKEAADWDAKARLRRIRMDQYCWNPSRGLYFDYDFEKAEQSSYEFATTFFPLWAGAATPGEAHAVERSFWIV